MGRRPLSNQEKRNRIAFGDRLKQLRTKRSLSLNETAKACGIDHTRLARIESGERPFDLTVLMALARVYDTPWQVLILASPRQQLPMALSGSLLGRPQEQAQRDERFNQRVTAEERRELELFLGNL